MDIDEQLVLRLEASAVSAGLNLVDSLRLLDPTSPADGCEFLGGALIAMGRGRYVNRAIGVSMNELSASDVEAIEQFFVDREVAPSLELSTWAPAPTIAALARRNFTPNWFRSVFAISPRSLDVTQSADLRIDRVGEEDVELWLDVFARGFGADHQDTRAISDEIARASYASQGSQTFIAHLGALTVGCGAVQIVDGVAWLGGAATIPGFRGRGVQSALVAHRLRVATDLGCELGAATAYSGGASARNLSRLGFQHTHTQVVVEQRTSP